MHTWRPDMATHSACFLHLFPAEISGTGPFWNLILEFYRVPEARKFLYLKFTEFFFAKNNQKKAGSGSTAKLISSNSSDLHIPTQLLSRWQSKMLLKND
jgi:hypothetical protein